MRPPALRRGRRIRALVSGRGRWRVLEAQLDIAGRLGWWDGDRRELGQVPRVGAGSMSEPAITEALLAVAKLAEALGVRAINRLPGCWEHQIDSRWWVAMNGHREAIASSHGPKVGPFECYVEFNGWPAAVFSAAGGSFAAGAAANEETFLEAVREATERARA